MNEKLLELCEKRLEKLKAENRSLKENLALLNKDCNDLRKSLRDRRRLFDSIPAGIVLVQHGRITDINKKVLAGLGYEVEEVIGRDFLDFVHGDQKATVKSLHKKRVLREQVPDQYDIELETKDGEKRYCNVRVKRIRYHGRTAFIANLTPLAERIEKEKEDLKAKKMEALTTMAAGVSTEFSRYFEIITRNINDLQAMADPENQDIIGCIKRIESTFDKARSTTEKLDSITNNDTDQTDWTLLDLRKVVRNAVAKVNLKWRNEPQRRDLKISLKTFLRPTPSIEGNPEEITDAISIMIMNACEAMPEGGDIYLTTEENAGYAHIYIQDNGIGISLENRDRIFDPFFTTGEHDGIGLGLSLVYAIAKRHKGEIEVSSQKDQGTIFNLRFPIASQEATSKTKSVRRNIKDARILIIKGEDISRELLSQLLINRGCRVVMAESGLEGLGILEKKKFDLILADTSAFEIERELLIRKIKKGSRNLPIVIMTEREATDRHDHFRRSEVDLFIKKPIDMNKILKQISEVLVGRR